MQDLIENNAADLPEEGKSSEPAKVEPPVKNEPEVLIKREKYTFLHMLRNVVIYMLILAALYFCSPVELVTVSSSSMQPALPVGSVSVAVKTDKDTEYQIGDIVTFSVEYDGTYYSRITHRIVSIDGDLITTKGDANPANDPFTIHKSQIRNVVKWINIFKI
jgi:signal peptidase I